MMKQGIIILCFVLCSNTIVNAQEEISPGIVHLSEQLAAQVERIAESTDANFDYSDLLEDYIYLADHPLNINHEEVYRLRELYLISAFQYENLMLYVDKYGPLVSLHELTAIEGFDEQTLALIRPLVYVGKQEATSQFEPGKVIKWGRHQLIARTERTIEKQAGYKPISDSAWQASPNSHYLGGPQKIYARYTFDYRKKFRAGITMDKDAGEPFLINKMNDSIQKLSGNKLRNGFDFYSAHAFASGIGFIKAFALGDYHLAFGQGITMWSGLSFGKSTDANGVMKYGPGLRPNTSVNENLFLRGGAATFSWWKFELTGFYSSKYADANVVYEGDTLNEYHYATSFQESGLHRTVNEVQDKSAIKQLLYGGRISFRDRQFEAGLTMHRTSLSTSLDPQIYPYNKFRFAGNTITNQGVDFRYILSKIICFGELGMSDNAALAGIIGITTQPVSFATLTLAYRNYDKSYQNLYSNAFSESAASNNETGFYAGLVTGLSASTKLTAYADFFTFPWLRYQTDAPSNGHDYFVQLDHIISRSANISFRFRTKTKMTNDDNPWNRIDYLVHYTKDAYRLHLSYAVSPSITFKDRAEWVVYKQASKPTETGFIIYHDVVFRKEKSPVELTMRYALFDTDSYDSRVYAYENDVLYAFSIPSFYDKGSRLYLLVKLRLMPSLDLWLRAAQTWYADRHEISSGLDLISGNTKTDIKLQLRWKL
ncbi:MAG: hypothetical protein KGZ82_12605 [Bacteroidales bacterium]|nr:hypothetical protein [Bacteroidales bacterium]